MAKSSTISQKQTRFAATSILYVIVVLAILAAVNWLANRYNQTVDTTKNQQFTLSDQTKKIIRGLKEDATITYFDVPDAFPQARTIFDRYTNLSHKIHVQYVNPRKNPELVMTYGVRDAGTAFVTIGQRREEVRSLNEEGITAAFVKDLKGVRKVCFVQGSGESTLDNDQASGVSQLKTVLQHDNYDTQALTLLDKSAVPSDCKVILVPGPKNDYTANEIDALRSYVQGGGSVLFALDPPLDLQHEHIAANKPLTDLLASWGVTLQNNIVLEQDPRRLTSDVGPVFPLVKTYESHPITDALKDDFTGFLITRSMQVANTDKTTVAKLLETTDSAVATTKLNNAGVSVSDPGNQHGVFILGAAGTYTTGNPQNEGHFVVFGTSRILENAETGIHFQANRDLVLNSINWLASDQDLISIRPKQPDDQRLNMTQVQSKIFNYVDLIALPLFIIVIGVSILWKRR